MSNPNDPIGKTYPVKLHILIVNDGIWLNTRRFFRNCHIVVLFDLHARYRVELWNPAGKKVTSLIRAGGHFPSVQEARKAAVRWAKCHEKDLQYNLQFCAQHKVMEAGGIRKEATTTSPASVYDSPGPMFVEDYNWPGAKRKSKQTTL